MTTFSDALTKSYGTKNGRISAKKAPITNKPSGDFSSVIDMRKYYETTRTTNGMKAFTTTSSDVLNLFSRIGSARKTDLSKEFIAALVEDEDLTLRTILWARDITSGAGERSTFRKLIALLDSINPYVSAKIMHRIPDLGRWDDLFAYTDYINRVKAKQMIAKALLEDKNGLAAKWMPRKGPIAVELTKFLELTPKQYRKLLVSLTNVVETKMCAKEWNDIDFSKIPSLASARYQKAFGRNAQEKYSAYLHELKKPVEDRAKGIKINAAAVYPYDVVKSVITGNSAVADAQWDALPNYVGDAKVLPLVDVSGSMGTIGDIRNFPKPIHVAVSLGLYLSSKNTGKFKDLFLTFSAEPSFVRVSGDLSSRMRQMSTSKWEMNTDLNSALDEILRVAVEGRVPQNEMPSTLLVLSDMQFDGVGSKWSYGNGASMDKTSYDLIIKKFTKAGYKVPKIVYWNLNGGISDNTPVKFDSYGSALVSGFSPSIMKSVLSGNLEKYTPYNVMLETIRNVRYDY